MSPDADRKLANWFDSMHFSSYDQAYEWMRSHQHGSVFKSQLEALDNYFQVFVPLPFVELQPSNVLQRIQAGESPVQTPPEDLLSILPEPQIVEPPPQFEEEPNINPIRRIFNAIRGIFG
jgi:hypothetical protein